MGEPNLSGLESPFGVPGQFHPRTTPPILVGTRAARSDTRRLRIGSGLAIVFRYKTVAYRNEDEHDGPRPDTTERRDRRST